LAEPGRLFPPPIDAHLIALLWLSRLALPRLIVVYRSLLVLVPAGAGASRCWCQPVLVHAGVWRQANSLCKQGASGFNKIRQVQKE
jgi:hypothetical protein